MGKRFDPIKVCPGDTIVVNIDPPVMPGHGRTSPGPANPNAGWLARDDMGGTTITIQVPDKTKLNRKFYEYILTLDGIGRLDPRVIIQ